MVNRRAGFTLLELVTVIVIIGLLAAIAFTRFWTVKERGYWAAIKSDIRASAVQQERYYEKNMEYASDPTLLPDYTNSPGVTITVTWASNQGWAATATHSSFTGKFCGYFTGPAPAGIAPPATNAGEIKCDE